MEEHQEVGEQNICNGHAGLNQRRSIRARFVDLENIPLERLSWNSEDRSVTEKKKKKWQRKAKSRHSINSVGWIKKNSWVYEGDKDREEDCQMYKKEQELSKDDRFIQRESSYLILLPLKLCGQKYVITER